MVIVLPCKNFFFPQVFLQPLTPPFLRGTWLLRYGILYRKCLNAIIKAGLNPMAGFLHSYQSGKPTLVYDLIEEFRSFVVDRGIFALLNRGEKLEQGEDSLLTPETRKKIVRSVIGNLSNEVWFQSKSLNLQEVIQKQAHNIKKHILDKTQYRPFPGRW